MQLGKALVKKRAITKTSQQHLLMKPRQTNSATKYTRRPTWWSGYCDLNKRECDLNQSKDGFFVKRVAKNNSWNNGDRHKIHEIFLTNCFAFLITLVWQTVRSSAMTQIYSKLNEENIATNCSRVAALALDGLTKKPFDHYAVSQIFSLRSPRFYQK